MFPSFLWSFKNNLYCTFEIISQADGWLFGKIFSSVHEAVFSKQLSVKLESVLKVVKHT